MINETYHGFTGGKTMTQTSSSFYIVLVSSTCKNILLESAESSIGYVEGGRRSRNRWYDDECAVKTDETARKRSVWLEDISYEGKLDEY